MRKGPSSPTACDRINPLVRDMKKVSVFVRKKWNYCGDARKNLYNFANSLLKRRARRQGHFSFSYFIVIEYETSAHSGAEHLSQLISPFDAVLRALTIEPIISVKSNLPSAHSKHKQFNLNAAELPGEKLTVRDSGFASPA
jgi:hypothetical protein